MYKGESNKIKSSEKQISNNRFTRKSTPAKTGAAIVGKGNPPIKLNLDVEKGSLFSVGRICIVIHAL